MNDYSMNIADIDEMMRELREEIKLREKKSRARPVVSDCKQEQGAECRDAAGSRQEAGGGEASRPGCERGGVAEAAPQLQYRDEYDVAELCALHNEEFIKNAYQVLLRRQPDAMELASWRQRLSRGVLGKKEILGRLRYSPEGRGHDVRVRGLLLPHVMNCLVRLPVVGKIIKIAGCVARLPVVYGNLAALEGTVFGLNERLAARITRLEGSLELQQRALEEKGVALQEFENNLNSRIMQLTYMKDKVVDEVRQMGNAVLEQMRVVETDTEQNIGEVFNDLRAVDAKVEAFSKYIEETGRSWACGVDAVEKQMAETVNPAITQLRRQLTENQDTIRGLKREVIDHRRYVNLLLGEARKRLPEPLSGEQLRNMLNEEENFAAALYATFEDKFRGTREDIKARLSVHLPRVEKAVAEVGGGVLDLGCGRGEWLELLKQSGCSAQGVDLNGIMVGKCRERGLDAVNSDARGFIEALAPASLAAVTGFHLVEHLSLGMLTGMLDGVLRVLKPGGIVIFESPNPENLMVGACDFYYDPAHVRPIPPETLKFLLESRGFVDLEILRLREADEAGRQGSGLSEELLARFYGAREYAVIGVKA